MNTITTTSWHVPACNPKAHISVNHNRIKVYDNNKLYLKDGTEFEIEFDNDSDCYVKAEITINGIRQNYGLVLKPHQRFYLDRFMDEKKKLKFNTFLTGNDDIEKLKEILEKNGKIDIKFYRETLQNITWTYSNSGMYEYPNTTNSPTIKYYGSISNTSGKIGDEYNDLSAKSNSSWKRNSNIGAKLYSKSMSSDTHLYSAQASLEKPKEIETGRIESGNKSSQDFIYTDKNFEFFTTAEFFYHILPESQKPKKVEKSKNYIMADEKQFRAYCNICGRKVKKGWQFCPGCGNKF